MKLRLFTVSCVLLLSVAIPEIGIVVCGIILAFQIALMCLRPVIARLPTPLFRTRDTFECPVFSVHVATHSEPPELVICTLRALLDQDWSKGRYEIIVMDNNTTDDALWKPVANFCAGFSERLTFLHKTGVQGAKAGALNIALDHTRADASHIVTVDADYIVEAGFLRKAAAALELTGADYVQFPQAYIGISTAAAGVDAELEEYFRSNVAIADEAEAVLLTGTLCIISREALMAAGGWSGETTTEDAEMGVRLCHAGFTGRFINQIVGKGLLPLSLGDLEKQRYRWCSGNFQTLMKHARLIFAYKSSLSLYKRLVVISQLTAWLNLTLVPAALLLFTLLMGRDPSVTAAIAASVIVLTLLDIFSRIVGRCLRDRLGFGMMIHALACRIALAPQSAKATFDAILGQKLSFVVTNKSAHAAPSGVQVPTFHLVLFMIAILALVGTQPSSLLTVAALLVLMLPLPAALLTDNSLHAYRLANRQLCNEVAL